MASMTDKIIGTKAEVNSIMGKMSGGKNPSTDKIVKGSKATPASITNKIV